MPRWPSRRQSRLARGVARGHWHWQLADDCYCARPARSRASSSAMISREFCRLACCRGVFPVLSATCGSAPRSSSNRTNSDRLCRTARMSGVRPSSSRPSTAAPRSSNAAVRATSPDATADSNTAGAGAATDDILSTLGAAARSAAPAVGCAAGEPVAGTSCVALDSPLSADATLGSLLAAGAAFANSLLPADAAGWTRASA
jgi:hypothetical protein